MRNPFVNSISPIPGRFVSDGDTQAELIDGLLFESQVMVDFTNLIMFFVVFRLFGIIFFMNFFFGFSSSFINELYEIFELTIEHLSIASIN